MLINDTLCNMANETVKDLTPRELEIIGLIPYGLGNKEIAQRLHISVDTVKEHIVNALKKTKAENRTRLAVLITYTGKSHEQEKALEAECNYVI